MQKLEFNIKTVWQKRTFIYKQIILSVAYEIFQVIILTYLLKNVAINTIKFPYFHFTSVSELLFLTFLKGYFIVYMIHTFPPLFTISPCLLNHVCYSV